MKRLSVLSGLGAMVLLATAGPAWATAADTAAQVAATRERTGRVLVISLPDVEWSDFASVSTPNLDRLFSQSSIGALITNGVERPSLLGSSYVSLGAGARATTTATTSGLGFGVDEEFGRDNAGNVFAARMGIPPGDGLVYMPIDDAVSANDAELYGAKPGLLGDELATAGVSRAVIANGDGSDPSTPEERTSPYRRAAVAALMTHNGRVPGGQVDRALLRQDATVPFGVRLDPDKVVAAFQSVWKPRSVVLVEGSDLVRADLAARFASDQQRLRLRHRALRDTDRIVGRLLESVRASDAVIVVGPVAPTDTDALTVASVRAPGLRPGVLRSTTTQRDGFVNLVDVAPTILRYFGLERPDAMEGRRMETGEEGGSLADRIEPLVHANADGTFRDGLVGASMGVIVGVACALALGAVLVDRSGRGREWLVLGGLWLLGYLDATYLAGPFHFGRHGGAAAYWAFVIGVGVVLAFAFWAVAHRLRARTEHRLGARTESRLRADALIIGLASVVALHLGDLVTGAHLEWNTVFGYSPTIGIRFVGEGNLTFAQLAAAAIFVAGLVVWQAPTRRVTQGAVALLAVTFVVIGAPFWGNDFGGAISAAPGFALMGWLLLGRRLRWRTVFGLAGVLVGTAITVGLLDLLRPADQRTHVGKFFEKAGTDFSSATLVIRRKASDNLSVLGHSLLLGCIIVVALLLAYLWFVSPRSLRSLVEGIPTARAVALALAVTAALGFALNDSGITIPGMMMAVFESSLVFLVARPS